MGDPDGPPLDESLSDFPPSLMEQPPHGSPADPHPLSCLLLRQVLKVDKPKDLQLGRLQLDGQPIASGYGDELPVAR